MHVFFIEHSGAIKLNIRALALLFLIILPQIALADAAAHKAVIQKLYNALEKMTAEQREHHSEPLRVVLRLFTESLIRDGKYDENNMSRSYYREGFAKGSLQDLVKLNGQNLPVLMNLTTGLSSSYQALDSSFFTESALRSEYQLRAKLPDDSDRDFEKRALRNQDLGKWFFEMVLRNEDKNFSPIRIELPHPPYAFSYEEVLAFEKKLLQEVEARGITDLYTLIGGFNYIKGPTEREYELLRRLTQLSTVKGATDKLVQNGTLQTSDQKLIMNILTNELDLTNKELVKAAKMKPFPLPLNATGPISCSIILGEAQNRFQEMQRLEWEEQYKREAQEKYNQQILQKIFEALQKAGHKPTVH